jgi:hypothetical protein
MEEFAVSIFRAENGDNSFLRDDKLLWRTANDNLCIFAL